VYINKWKGKYLQNVQIIYKRSDLLNFMIRSWCETIAPIHLRL